MEPVSSTASIIAITGLACKSCQTLISFFRDISEVRADILHFCCTLQSLDSTLQDIKLLCTDPQINQYITPNLTNCLESCLSEVQDVDTKCQKAQKLIQRGTLHSGWARLRWYLSAEHWLKKFLAHIQTYHIVLSLEWSTLQTKILVWSQPGNVHAEAVGHSQKTQCCTHPLGDSGLLDGGGNPPDQDTTGCGSLASLEVARHAASTETIVNEEHVSGDSRLAQFLRSYSEPFAIRSEKMRSYNASLGSLCCWIGPTIFKKWTEKGQELFGVRPERTAFGLRITVRSCVLYLPTLSLEVFVQKEIHRLEKWSIRWSVSFPNIVSKDSCVIRLASIGDVKGVMELFGAGKAGCTDTTLNGTSLLHIAARESHMDLVKFLLECGADPNAIDDDGETPLHFAMARSHDQNVSRKLIQSGADVCTRSAEGKTPFHTFFRESNRAFLASLYAAVETELVDNRGMHLLHYLAWSCKSTVADIGPLLACDASSVFAKDHEGRTVLFFAAERGNFAILESLLKSPNRPQLSDTDSNGLSLMHYAVRSRRTETIKILNHHGCSIRALDNNKQTPLHHAAKRGNLAAVKGLLLLDGSDLLGRVDKCGRTPLDLAKNAGKIDVMAHFQSISPSYSHSTDDTGSLPCHSQLHDARKQRQFFAHWIYRRILSLSFWQILALLAILVFGAWMSEHSNLGYAF